MSWPDLPVPPIDPVEVKPVTCTCGRTGAFPAGKWGPAITQIEPRSNGFLLHNAEYSSLVPHCPLCGKTSGTSRPPEDGR
jgi:hypothetical protein